MAGRTGGDPEEDAGLPRWVKVFGIVAAVLAVLVIAMVLLGGGNHGPGRHLSSSGTAGYLTHAVIVDGGGAVPPAPTASER